MKLNYRDKIVLTVLIVLLVWAVGIMFFVKPAIEDVQSAQNELDSARVTLQDLQDKIKKDADLDDRIDAAYADVKTLTATFYKYQEAQEATQLIDDLLATDELINNNMVISGYGSARLAPYSYTKPIPTAGMDKQVLDYEKQNYKIGEEPKPAEEEKTEEVEGPVAAPVAIGSYSINFEFTGSMDNIKKFCDELKKSNDQRTNVVQSLNIPHTNEEGKDEDELKANISLLLYVLRELPAPVR